MSGGDDDHPDRLLINDKDGWTDLYVTSAGNVNNIGPGQHKLYRNNGNGSFTDVATAAGVNFSHPLQSDGWGTCFGDNDNDGGLGLFIAADFGTSQLVLNDGDGTFTNGTAAAGVGLDEKGMGGCMGDFDNDGWFDWYVTSIYLPSFSWTGNKLYMNDGDGSSFTDAAVSSGLDFTGEGRGMMHLDYDNDGDPDLLIGPFLGVSRLFQNEVTGTGTRWLRLFLDTMRNEELPAHGYGAIVSVTAGGTTRWRQMWGGDHYLGGSEMSAHFGLGAATVADTINVEWPNGEVTALNNVPTNRTITIQAPASDGWHTVSWGLGGTNGVPKLLGDGDLSDGSTVSISLTQARPSATPTSCSAWQRRLSPSMAARWCPT